MFSEINVTKDFLDFLDLVIIALCTASGWKSIERVKRRFWVRDLFLERDISGFFATTFETLRNDPERFFMATRMSPDVFDILFQKVGAKLIKSSSRAILPQSRLLLTLIYLAHGPSRQYLSLTFKMSVPTIRKIVLETCGIIWNELHTVYLKTPDTEDWKQIAEDFKNMWDLPNCIGAIDGKHIAITCPKNSGSQFYNYKGTYSIVLLGVCDANYMFTAVDIGAFGSQSDGGVLTYSEFGRKLDSNYLGFPPNSPLPGTENDFPFYIVGDAAFPLKSYMMRPYPGLLLNEKKYNFNKRLSRARRTIENAFGILTARWRILRNSLNMSPESAEKVVCACLVLHNFLKELYIDYCPEEFVDREKNGVLIEGLWRKENDKPKKMSRLSSNNSTKKAFQQRDYLCEYLFLNQI